jgi:plastocyanin
MRTSWSRLGVLFAVLAMVAGVACSKSTPSGSGGTSSPSASTSAPVTLSGKVTNKGTKDLTSMGKTINFSLEADDEDNLTKFYFEPTFIKVTPGGKVTVKVENEGTTDHNFSITALHIDQTIAKGQDKEITLTLPSSGAVAFFCKFHVGSGMQGAFFFNPGDTVITTNTSSTTGSTSGGTGYNY